MTPNGDLEQSGSLLGGCVSVLFAAVLTSLMLFINGSFVFALTNALASSGPAWTRNPEFTQFILYLAPVLLVIGEWRMIDYVRTRFGSIRGN